jgi:plastocyanin
MRLALVALALMVAAVPAADARPPTATAPAKCMPSSGAPKKVKPRNGCRRLGGASRGLGRPTPMVAAGTPPVVDPPPEGSPPIDTPTTPAPAAARLGVTAREWSLVLSRVNLPAGPALVELQNRGEDAHNLRIERLDGSGTPLDVPLAEAGEVKSGEATLAAGTYKVYCALPGHDAAGMHAQLTVSPG